MQHRFEVSAIAFDLENPAYAAELLGRLGCETRVASQGGVTVLSSHIEAARGVGAIAAFMRRLECAQVKFAHIRIGDAARTLADHVGSFETREAPVALAA
jgi:hypothetical protein